MYILLCRTSISCYAIRCCNLLSVLVGSVLSDAFQRLTYERAMPDILEIVFWGLRRPKQDIADIKVCHGADTIHSHFTGVLPAKQRL